MILGILGYLLLHSILFPQVAMSSFAEISKDIPRPSISRTLVDQPEDFLFHSADLVNPAEHLNGPADEKVSEMIGFRSCGKLNKFPRFRVSSVGHGLAAL